MNTKPNPFPFASALHWLLENPIETQFQELPAEIEKWQEEWIGGFNGFPSFSLPIWLSPCRRNGLGITYAVGGIALKTREGLELPWKRVLEKGILETFALNNLSELLWIPCLVCLWHGRSVAVRNPKNNLLFWPEKIAKSFNN